MRGLIGNGFFVALLAHGLIVVSLVWDKVLLRQPETRDLASYVFWVGALSILGLLLIPFGFRVPAPPIAALGFEAGLVHLAANFFY